MNAEISIHHARFWVIPHTACALMVTGPAHLDFSHVGCTKFPIDPAYQLSGALQGPKILLRVMEDQMSQGITEAIILPLGKDNAIGIGNPHFDGCADVERWFDRPA